MKGQTTTARARGEPDIAQALMDAVTRSPTWPSGCSSTDPRCLREREARPRVYKAAEGLALCGVELDEVIGDARGGYRHGVCAEGGGA